MCVKRFFLWRKASQMLALFLAMLTVSFSIGRAAEIASKDVDGVVKDDKGQPLAGATVLVYSAVPKEGPSDCPTCYPDCRKHEETGNFGEFRLPALDSRLLFKLLAVKSGYRPSFVSRVDPIKGLVEVTLKPVLGSESPDLQVNGRLIDTVGNPVKGAVVSVRGVKTGNSTFFGSDLGLEPLAVSDEHGDFRLYASRRFDSAILDVEARTFAKARFHSVQRGAAIQELKLTEGAGITGRLLKDGQPLAGVEVGVSDVQRSTGESMGRYSVLTDQNGRFVFTSIPPDRSYYFFAGMRSMEGKGCLTTRVIQVGADGSELALGELSSHPGYFVAGRIQLADGSPLPKGVRLFLSREEAADFYEVSPELDGSFRFTDVPTEVMKLSMRLDGYRMSLRNAGLDPLNPNRLLGSVAADLQGLLIDIEPGRPYDNPVSGVQRIVRSEPLRGAEPKQPAANDILTAGKVIDAETGQPLREFKVTEGRYDGFQEAFIWFDTRKAVFTDGVFAARFTNAKEPLGLLIEASGYLPKATNPLSASDTNLVFALKRGSGLTGVVKLPDGRPAGNVTVYLVDKKNALSIVPDIRMQLDLNHGIQSKRTDANGRFSFPPLVDAFALYVYEGKGFAEIPIADFEKKPVIQMQTLARVEGKLLVGNRPAGGERILLGYSPPPYFHYPRNSTPLNLSFETVTRADGTFVFEGIPPVPVEVSFVPKVKDSKLGFLPISQNTGLLLKPGETRTITLGGQGRLVTGRIVIDGYSGKIDWRQDVTSLELVVGGPPGIPSLTAVLSEYSKALFQAKTEPEKAAVRQLYLPQREAIIKQLNEFYHTEAGMQYHFSKKRYALDFQQDGSFRVEDVPDGVYQLNLSLHSSGRDGRNPMSAPLIATSRREVQVTAGKNGQPLDLGTILIPAKQAMKAAKKETLPGK